MRVANFTILVVILPLVVSCQTNSSTSKLVQSATPPPSNPGTTKPLQVALVPSQSSSTQQNQKLQPLVDYLQKTLNRPVSFQITKDYETAVNLMVTEDVDMAYLGPLSYIQARARNPDIEPLVSPIKQETGRPWYTSIIVVNIHKGIKSISDLKGKRFAFVSPSSTSGFLLPMNAFEKNHIDPSRDFAHIRYSLSHDKAEKDLEADAVDAIADSKLQFLQSQKAGKLLANKYKIIWESDPIPSSPIVINKKKFSPLVISKLRQALIDAPIGFDVEGSKTAGYTIGQDTDFEGIRQIYFRLKSVKVAAK
jgi:phosphonate transport system substrate-binding protein